MIAVCDSRERKYSKYTHESITSILLNFDHMKCIYTRTNDRTLRFVEQHAHTSAHTHTLTLVQAFSFCLQTRIFLTNIDDFLMLQIKFEKKNNCMMIELC